MTAKTTSKRKSSTTSSKPKATTKKTATVPATAKRVRRPAVSEAFIIENATRLFSERGYPAISIRDIVAACEVNIPSIYHYFKDKDDLYDRCCEHVWREVSGPLLAAIAGSEDPRLRLKRFTIVLSNVLLQAEQFRKMLQRELLLSRSKRFENLTNRHFVTAYRVIIPVVASVARLPEEEAKARALSIYALTFGLILMRPIADIGGVTSPALEGSAVLAEFVLQTLFPGLDWTSI